MYGSYSQRNIIFQDIFRTFPGQITISRTTYGIQDLKVINQDMYEKAYLISY